jgi:hypothetical protein
LLTLFTVPKPFHGHIGDVQWNALKSWRALGPNVQIVLVGDESGVAEVARDASVEHAGGLLCSERGTPRLDSAFDLVGALARQPLWCFINSDIVLLDDFLPAIERVSRRFRRFLVVGESRDLALAAGTRLEDPAFRSQLRARALSGGRLRGYAALDYFVFPNGLLGPLPPFLIGRACFDNWLVWRARDLGHPVVDATRTIVAVHQSHDYAHVPGGLEEAYYGAEARHNERLAGGRPHIFSLHDASHRLYSIGFPLRYLGSAFRARERARVGRVQLGIRLEALGARRAERRLRGTERSERPSTHDRQPVRVIGVFPHPTPERAAFLDAVAQPPYIDLTVLYGAKTTSSAPFSVPLRNHVHWFPRSFRLPGASRMLGYDYVVNWAIWNSFRGMRPDCIVVSGWNTFATQAAIAWCLLRGTPYLLVIEARRSHATRRRRPTAMPRTVTWIIKRAAGTIVIGSAHDGIPDQARTALSKASRIDEAVPALIELIQRAVGGQSSQFVPFIAS